MYRSFLVILVLLVGCADEYYNSYYTMDTEEDTGDLSNEDDSDSEPLEDPDSDSETVEEEDTSVDTVNVLDSDCECEVGICCDGCNYIERDEDVTCETGGQSEKLVGVCQDVEIYEAFFARFCGGTSTQCTGDWERLGEWETTGLKCSDPKGCQGTLTYGSDGFAGASISTCQLDCNPDTGKCV